MIWNVSSGWCPRNPCVSLVYILSLLSLAQGGRASNSSHGDKPPLTQSIPISGLQVTAHNIPLIPSPPLTPRAQGWSSGRELPCFPKYANALDEKKKMLLPDSLGPLLGALGAQPTDLKM